MSQVISADEAQDLFAILIEVQQDTVTDEDRLCRKKRNGRIESWE